jgi:hypothetical protein
MTTSETVVNMKLVDAIASEARVGFSKPTILKIVAEKYMSEFCKGLSALSIN